MSEIKYQKGQEVTVLTLQGKKAGTGIVESFNVKEDRYKIRFQYPLAKEEELIEVPSVLLLAGKARAIFEKTFM